MISFLKGIILSIKPTCVIIDVNGVGYEVNIPLSTYEQINSASSVQLFVHMIVRENGISLFGFSTEDEKHMFTILLNVSGIGPSIGISILSSMTPKQIVSAVQSDDVRAFKAIPGLGQNKSEKIIFELKRTLKKYEGISGKGRDHTSLVQDAIDALITLGFDEKQAFATVSSIVSQNPDFAHVEHVLRLALKQLSK